MSHAPQTGPGIARTTVRVGDCVRTVDADDIAAAALFERMVEAAGGNRAVARLLSCDETLVRRMRCGAKPVRLTHVLAVAEGSQRAAAALAAELRARSVAPRGSLPTQMRAVRIARAALAMADATGAELEQLATDVEAEMAAARAQWRAVG